MSTEVKARSQELSKMLNRNFVKAAYEKGRSLSAHLEAEDPSSEYKDGLDAFQRQLMHKNIRTANVAEAGVWADPFGRFMDDEAGMVLGYEWASRTWRSAAMGRPVSTRAIYLSTDQAVNSLQRPYANAAQARADLQIAPAIPLEAILGTTTGIDSDAYRKFYVTNSTADQRMVRVAEGTELAGVKITGAEQTTRLKKFGRKIEITYESLRRIRLNMLSLHIARMAIQAEMDKVSAVIDVIVNGDGNTGTAAEVISAATVNSAAVTGTLDLKSWLAFKKRFAAPYAVNTALMSEALSTSLELLNVGSANIMLSQINQTGNFGSIAPINATNDMVRYGWTSDAPSGQIVAFDKRFAVERVYEIGGNIQEMDRFVTRQVEVMTLSEVEGYNVIDPEAAKILNVAF